MQSRHRLTLAKSVLIAAKWELVQGSTENHRPAGAPRRKSTCTV